MSDTFVRVIPTSPVWQPTSEAAQAAREHVAGLYGGEGGSVDVVEASFHDLVRLIDAGTNTTSVICSACRWQLGPAFLEQLATSHPDGFATLDVWVPCCGAVVPVTSHWYQAPVGFARFEVTARNPVRDTPWLRAEELEQVAGILGHPVFQVVAHLPGHGAGTT